MVVVCVGLTWGSDWFVCVELRHCAQCLRFVGGTMQLTERERGGGRERGREGERERERERERDTETETQKGKRER